MPFFRSQVSKNIMTLINYLLAKFYRCHHGWETVKATSRLRLICGSKAVNDWTSKPIQLSIFIANKANEFEETQTIICKTKYIFLNATHNCEQVNGHTKLNKTIVFLELDYGSETWVITKDIENTITPDAAAHELKAMAMGPGWTYHKPFEMMIRGGFENRSQLNII